MSELLPASARRELDPLRLLPRSARAAVGVGDRRSAQVGPGMEFEDFRAYEVGDDFRYIDRHVFARLGQRVVRQYAVEKQLEVTLLLDGSGSLGVGGGEKLATGKALCAAIAHVTLNGGDRVKLGVARGKFIDWHPVVTAESGLGALLVWLDRQEAKGELLLERVAGIGPSTVNAGLLVVVSDWLLDGAPQAIRSWSRRWREVVGIMVLGEDDRVAAPLDLGSLLKDVETGETLSVFGDDLLARYTAELEAWEQELKREFGSRGGLLLRVPAGSSTSEQVAALRAARLLG